jgi:hypothetical protein
LLRERKVARIDPCRNGCEPLAKPRVVDGALSERSGMIGCMQFGGGFAVSYYGEIVGGLRGAIARGYERTY